MPTSWLDTPPDEFSVDAQIEGPTLSVSIQGELDLATGPLLLEAVVRNHGDEMADVEHVTLDLARLTFIDAAGLRALLGVVGERTVSLVDVPPPARRLFELTGHEAAFGLV